MAIRKYIVIIFILFLTPYLLIGATKKEMQEASQAMGKILRHQLETSQMQLSFKDIAKGMQKKISKEELGENEKIFLSYQQKMIKEFSEKNWQEADEFFKENKKKKSVLEIENKKIQYEVLHPGEKDQSILEHHSPLVTIKGSYLDGETFYQSEEPEKLNFSQTTPALKHAIIGMKKKEKRKIYLHPDLGYNTNSMFHKNALVVFEVEILDIDHKQKESSHQPRILSTQ